MFQSDDLIAYRPQPGRTVFGVVAAILPTGDLTVTWTDGSVSAVAAALCDPRPGADWIRFAVYNATDGAAPAERV